MFPTTGDTGSQEQGSIKRRAGRVDREGGRGPRGQAHGEHRSTARFSRGEPTQRRNRETRGVIVGNFVEHSESLSDVVERGTAYAGINSLFDDALRGC